MLSSIINYLFKKVMEFPIVYTLGYKAVYFYSYCEIYANKYLPVSLFNNNNKIINNNLKQLIKLKNEFRMDKVGKSITYVARVVVVNRQIQKIYK